MFSAQGFCVVYLSHTRSSLQLTSHLGNINQTTTPLAPFDPPVEANGQEIIGLKTTLAKVSQITEMKLVTLKKSRAIVTDRLSIT